MKARRPRPWLRSRRWRLTVDLTDALGQRREVRDHTCMDSPCAVALRVGSVLLHCTLRFGNGGPVMIADVDSRGTTTICRHRLDIV